MGTHLYDSFHSLERILEGNQETRKEVLTMFGGHVEFNGCDTFRVTVFLKFTQLATYENGIKPGCNLDNANKRVAEPPRAEC